MKRIIKKFLTLPKRVIWKIRSGLKIIFGANLQPGRTRDYPLPELPVTFSIVMSIYAKTDLKYFTEVMESIFAQDYKSYQMLLIINGPVSAPLRKYVNLISHRDDVQIREFSENQGIIKCLDFALRETSGDYLIPIDSDDLITPDALRILASEIRRFGNPDFVYSDEDLLVNGLPGPVYKRPDWDPILNLCSSYIWHLTAIKLRTAKKIRLYSDYLSTWCHDWETSMLMFRHKMHIAHVPEVLYHWRQHANSSTNSSQPISGSLESQKHVLQKFLLSQKEPERYDIVQSPVFRGAFEWHIRRIPDKKNRWEIIVLCTDGDSAREFLKNNMPVLSQFAGQVLLVTEDSGPAPKIQGATHVSTVSYRDWAGKLAGRKKKPVDFSCVLHDSVSIGQTEWLWEAQKHFELIPDLGIVAGKILDSSGIVRASGIIFGYGNGAESPAVGKPLSYPGNFALNLKAHCVSAPHSGFFTIRTKLLQSMLKSLLKQDWLRSTDCRRVIGPWLGAKCQQEGTLVGSSPLVTIEATSEPDQLLDADIPALRNEFPLSKTDLRWLEAHR